MQTVLTRAASPACPLCGASGECFLRQPDLFLGVRPELSHELFRCEPCGLYYQGAMELELLAQFYPSRYYERPPAGRLRAGLSTLRNHRRARAVEWRAADGEALDIGCGRGEVLAMLKGHGRRCVGMDWNAENAVHVADAVGAEVVGGPDALGRLADERFQAISMFHVLEHEQNPPELLRQAHRLLSPGGRLVVGVPSAASLTRLMFGRFWLGYDLPRHRVAFTPTSLRHVLDRAGFEVERLTGRFSDEWLDLSGSARLFCRGRGWRGRALPWLVTAALLVPITLASLLGYGSVMFAYARKR
jgi:2-polyprenyl-3-methyl-5-hydroxy-6-metoxy-1,4-benzoquinol methylase